MEPYIIDAVRTPFGRNRGGLSGVRVDDLAAHPITALIKRHSGLDLTRVTEVVYGNSNGAGEDNRNVARMAVLLSGLPETVPAVTVNRLCGSGAEAIAQAARLIRTGEADLVIAGGVEGMSRSPYVLPPIDQALPRDLTLLPTTIGWRMANPAFPAHWIESLGASAERVATEKGIGRAAQDDWALRSHQRAHAAWQNGLHDDFVTDCAGLTRDESIRPGTTAAALAGLAPAFTATGTVTAGNSSPINDGAVAVLLGSAQAAADLGVTPLARIAGSAVAALAPDRFTLAPVSAIHAALARTGHTLAGVDVVELNEAFAAMVLSCLDELPGLDPDRVNPNGGAIALGHPIGASAARAVVDCARHLRRTGGGTGITAACIGVGQGIALVLESP
ncbi:acetyl-CoA acetyltransferase [Acrocarpospora pleiomorpha]|uniref:Probable acetyl-CoA acetyltransferase n=1 Tax=Acrocarpospora pleiomorpha TaxID=90975 RepID=A0A5M3XX37_9ACTN|nr:thiolase family protein [Acrocarpospora pleiomorpha]GES25734.1 acetyl-CoA acetyltransferase [Acrocarpospora pleiomorpha]